MSLLKIARASRNAKILIDEAKKRKVLGGNSVIGNIPVDVDPTKEGAKESDCPEQGHDIAPVTTSSPSVAAEESISVHVPHTHVDPDTERAHLAKHVHPLATVHGGSPHPALPHEIRFGKDKAKEAMNFVKKLPAHLKANTLVTSNESVTDDTGAALFEEFSAMDSHKAKISTVKDPAVIKRVHTHLKKASALPGLSAEKKNHYAALTKHVVSHAADHGVTLETSGGHSDLPAPETAADVVFQAGMDEPPAGPPSHDEAEGSFLSRVVRVAAGKTELDEAKERLSTAGIELGAETAAFALIEDLIQELASTGDHVVHVKYKMHSMDQAKHTVHHLLNHAVKMGAHKHEADGYDGHIQFHFKTAQHAKKFHSMAADASHVHHTEVHHVEAHECVMLPTSAQIMEDGQGPNKIGPAGSCVIRLTTPMGDAHITMDKLMAKFGGQQNPGGGYKFPVETAQAFLNIYMRNGGKGYIDMGDGKKHGPNENLTEVAKDLHGIPLKGEISKLLGGGYWHENDTVGHAENMNAKELSAKLNAAKAALGKHGIDARLNGAGNFQVLKLKPKLEKPGILVNLSRKESVDEANMRSPTGHVSLRRNGMFTKNANGNWVRMSNKARLHLLAMQKAKAHKDSAKDEKDDKKKKEHEDKAEHHKKEAKDSFHELDKDEQDTLVAHHAVDDDDSDDDSDDDRKDGKDKKG